VLVILELGVFWIKVGIAWIGNDRRDGFSLAIGKTANAIAPSGRPIELDPVFARLGSPEIDESAGLRIDLDLGASMLGSKLPIGMGRFPVGWNSGTALFLVFFFRFFS
jgi:hypothetical protein